MTVIWIGTIVFFGLMLTWAIIDIRRQPSADDVRGQCMPSRPQFLKVDQPARPPEYQEHPARRLRWHGLEKHITLVKREAKK